MKSSRMQTLSSSSLMYLPVSSSSPSSMDKGKLLLLSLQEWTGSV